MWNWFDSMVVGTVACLMVWLGIEIWKETDEAGDWEEMI